MDHQENHGPGKEENPALFFGNTQLPIPSAGQGLANKIVSPTNI